MKKLIAFAALLFMSCAAHAQTINNLGAGRGSVIGADLFPSYQGANPAVRPSAAQIAAYVYGLASGDLTASGTGTHTLATVNSNVGSFGSATNCTAITVNAKGLITAASQVACTPPFTAITGRATLAQLPQGIANSIWINPTGSTADMQNVAIPACANDGAHGLVYVNGTGLQCATMTGGVTFANPTGTAGPTANNGVATTAMRSDATPAVQQASNSQKGLVQCDGTTVLCPSGIASAPPAVTSRSVTGTTDTILASDLGNIVYYSSASAVAITQPSPSGSFGAGFFTTLCNVNAGTLTVTPVSGLIGGAASAAVLAGTEAQPNCLTYQSNGTNFRLVPSYGTRTIASGTAALGTSAITSGSCATAVTVSAANVLTTDRIIFTPNADITAVTGYAPVTTGGLAIYPYPTSGNVNFKVCNPTSSSITPGAVTLNWGVER